jgi:hypothetical protein
VNLNVIKLVWHIAQLRSRFTTALGLMSRYHYPFG